MNVQQIEKLSQEKLYKQNIEINLFLKNINIANNIIEYKNKSREEKYNRFKKKGKSFEIAKIKSELMKLEKINNINNKHMNNDIKYIENKFINLYNKYNKNKYIFK